MKKLLLISIFAIFAILACPSCHQSSEGPDDTVVSVPDSAKMVYYGNGVYYFSCTKKEFGTQLSLFLSDPKNVLVTIAGDGTSSMNYGADVGYWVIVKEY